MAEKPVPLAAYVAPDLARWIEEQAAKTTRTKSQMIAHLLNEKRAEQQEQAGA